MITMLIECDDEGRLVLQFFSKAEIEQAVRAFIDLHLEDLDSGTLYLFFKQAEFAVKIALDALKERAFDALGYKLGGSPSGELHGHNVVISYPIEWQYSPAMDKIKVRHKQEIIELQEEEKMKGIAERVQGKGKIVVTLRSA